MSEVTSITTVNKFGLIFPVEILDQVEILYQFSSENYQNPSRTLVPSAVMRR